MDTMKTLRGNETKNSTEYCRKKRQTNEDRLKELGLAKGILNNVMQPGETCPTREIVIPPSKRTKRSSQEDCSIDDMSCLSHPSTHSSRDSNENNANDNAKKGGAKCYDLCSLSSFDEENDSSIGTQKLNQDLPPSPPSSPSTQQEDNIWFLSSNSSISIDYEKTTGKCTAGRNDDEVKANLKKGKEKKSDQDTVGEYITNPVLRRALHKVKDKSNLSDELKELAWLEEVGKMKYIEENASPKLRRFLQNRQPTDKLVNDDEEDSFNLLKNNFCKVLHDQKKKVKRKNPFFKKSKKTKQA